MALIKTLKTHWKIIITLKILAKIVQTWREAESPKALSMPIIA